MAADRFRALTKHDPRAITALVNLKTALRWLGKHARNEDEAVTLLTEANELDAKIASEEQRILEQRDVKPTNAAAADDREL